MNENGAMKRVIECSGDLKRILDGTSPYGRVKADAVDESGSVREWLEALRKSINAFLGDKP